MRHAIFKRVSCRRGAALVMCLFLVTMLASAGSTLAMIASTETIRADHEALNLDHELAVASLIASLPQLMANQKEVDAATRGASGGKWLSVSFGACEINCRVVDESSKLLINAATSAEQVASKVQSLSRENGLPVKSMDMRPIVDSPATKGWPKFVWFDQIVAQTELEEVFHRRPLIEETRLPEKRTWSDLVTFWDVDAARVLGLDIQTTVGRSVQRHYVVVEVAGDNTKVLYRGRP